MSAPGRCDAGSQPSPQNPLSACAAAPDVQGSSSSCSCGPQLFDEQELSRFQELLEREVQLASSYRQHASTSQPAAAPVAAVAAAASQQIKQQPVKSHALLRLLKKFRSALRSTSKSTSSAASSCKISGAANLVRSNITGPRADLKPPTAGRQISRAGAAVIHEHHHHHIYHIHHLSGAAGPGGGGGGDGVNGAIDHLDDDAVRMLVKSTRRHSDSHMSSPFIQNAPPDLPARGRRRRFSSDAPRLPPKIPLYLNDQVLD